MRALGTCLGGGAAIAIFVACTSGSAGGGSTAATPTPTPVPTPVKVSFSGIGDHGIGDPSLVTDPVSGRVWLTYSEVDISPTWPSQNTRVESTRLAFSDDKGQTWQDTGAVVNPYVDVTLPLSAPNNAGTWVNEVSQIVYDPGAPANEKYKLIWQHYLAINDGRHFDHSWLGMKVAASPQDLAAATEIKLFSGFLYDTSNNSSSGATHSPVSGAPKITLDVSYSTDLNTCVFAEPALYATPTALYMAVFCQKLSDSSSRIALMKCASPCSVSQTSSWTYLGTVLTSADATAAGFDGGFGAPSLFAGASGGVYLSVTPIQNSGAPWSGYYKGCRIYKFSNLDAGTLESSTPVRTVSGTDGSFNGACAYDKGATAAGMMYLELVAATGEFQIFSSGLLF